MLLLLSVFPHLTVIDQISIPTQQSYCSFLEHGQLGTSVECIYNNHCLVFLLMQTAVSKDFVYGTEMERHIKLLKAILPQFWWTNLVSIAKSYNYWFCFVLSSSEYKMYNIHSVIFDKYIMFWVLFWIILWIML